MLRTIRLLLRIIATKWRFYLLLQHAYIYRRTAQNEELVARFLLFIVR